MQTIGCKWVFKENGGILRVEDGKYQTKLVAKGYSQSEGIDFNEVFSSIVKHSSTCALLGMVR